MVLGFIRVVGWEAGGLPPSLGIGSLPMGSSRLGVFPSQRPSWDGANFGSASFQHQWRAPVLAAVVATSSSTTPSRCASSARRARCWMLQSVLARRADRAISRPSCAIQRQDIPGKSLIALFPPCAAQILLGTGPGRIIGTRLAFYSCGAGGDGAFGAIPRSGSRLSRDVSHGVSLSAANAVVVQGAEARW